MKPRIKELNEELARLNQLIEEYDAELGRCSTKELVRDRQAADYVRYNMAIDVNEYEMTPNESRNKMRDAFIKNVGLQALGATGFRDDLVEYGKAVFKVANINL